MNNINWSPKIIVKLTKTEGDRIIYHEDGSETDRDLNAAINLANYKEINQLNKKENTVRYTEIKADGEERFITELLDGSVRRSSMKSEKNMRSRGNFRFLQVSYIGIQTPCFSQHQTNQNCRKTIRLFERGNCAATTASSG